MEPFIYDSRQFRDELDNSPHHAGEVAFLRSIVRPGACVVEAGANRGVTAVALAREIGDAGHLYAFEPVPEYCAELKENLSRNGIGNASAFELALSNRPGRIRFYKHGGASGITRAEGAEMLWVEATTISDFVAERNINRLDLLNLDCEGSELLVFQGAESILERQAPQIFCEVHHAYLRELDQSVDDIVGFLHGIGYHVKPVRVEDPDAEITFQECSHICARKRDKGKKADEVRKKIADLKARWPAHSVRPSMMEELEELEEELKEAERGGQAQPGLPAAPRRARRRSRYPPMWTRRLA